MERMALGVPTASYCSPRRLVYSCSLTAAETKRRVPEGTDPCRHTNEHPKVCLSRPLALSSPVVKKKTIQIPSFDERGLIFERHNAKLSTAERSCDSVFAKTSVPSSWSKACRQRDSGERASTLPRVKPKAHSSQSLSAKPSIAISPAPEPNSPPTPPLLKSKPSSSLHLPASRSMDFSPILHRPEPKPSVSPTLTVPTPRLSPSPTSQNSDGPGGRQPSPVARERRARCIPISNTKVEPLGVAKHEVLDQGALLDFTRPGARRARPAMSRESRHQTHAPHNPRLLLNQTREASHPTSRGAVLKPDLQPHRCRSNQENTPEQHNSHPERDARGKSLNHTDVSGPPDHHVVPKQLLEHPGRPSVAPGLFDTNSFGSGSKRVFDLPQDRIYQRPDSATSAQMHQLRYSVTDRAFITEDSEDPYYVTMYYPGSVYVDMSDIVPPEVRPKPAVPAKPPNVGAPSPSNPFPPQGPGIGGGGISALPPSAIPVPIGSHGSGHGGNHIVGHSVGHAPGHTGSHVAAHSGGHSHGGTHGGPHGVSHGGSHSTSGGSTLLGYIGIDTIIEQMRKKTMKTGFDFNIMVVGHSGLGKSTLVNTLFKSQVSRKSAGWGRDEKIPKTVEIKTVSHVIEEGGVKMKLTVVDTPGFGDQINNDNCWEPISKHINEQFEKFLKEEVNITRKRRIPDTRVHCCLYFISPTGHSLRLLDVEFMKRLCHSVNIIPVIAKADTMTIEERLEFKQRVRKELEMNGIEFYPQKEFDDDMEDKSDNDKIRETMPFAVVGSDKEYQVNGKRVLGRKTPWGIVEVENPNHCEFAQLRDFLIRSHLQDLKEVTHNIHYETYRAKRLNANGGLHPIASNDTQESNL
ncbi:unnamed protein product [Menidia menidia]|uniref:Neuronal-specific septin-3 n=1 Tax=Menidia menidia TaxID=238744 RepID=A0A8S4B6F9_9TELE|nr:unnamed protein product [Menidia menidia]